MKDHKTFKYILRYKIDPEFNAEERIEELLRYCEKSKTEEVMLLFLAEELSTGHPTLQELEPYVAMGKHVKLRLREQGVQMSLNPWTTLYQISRGRCLKPGQNFTLMVGETGYINTVATCPLCPDWQEYLCNTFSYLVENLEPIALWIEDDWRLHNHDDLSGWGGCFCELHLKRFSEAVGCQVTRKELLKKILAPGKPHPWRSVWLEISHKSLLEPVIKLREAIQKTCPSTRLGLMSSAPDMHSAEGRDWPAFQHAIGNQPAFLTRPHLPPYTEINAIQCPPSVTRQTLANLQKPIEVYPELENSPRCGQYSKSAAYNIWECYNAVVFGSDGITINNFDMMGSGVHLDKFFSTALAKAKPKLSALLNLGIDDRNSQGVKVLFSPEISKFIKSSASSSINGICQNSVIWSKTLYTLGMAHRLTHEIQSGKTPYAVSGQTLRAFSIQDIEKLLSGPVLLDADSVDLLLELGFGELIGVKEAQWFRLEETGFAYESIRQSDASIYGIENPRMTAQRCSDKLLSINPIENACVKSTICRYDHKNLFPGAITFNNKIGGKILMLSYPLNGNSEFFMGFFNAFRRIMLQQLLFELAPQADLAVVENHPMHLYRVQTTQGLLLAAFNIIVDNAKELVVRIPHGCLESKSLLQLMPDGTWQSAPVKLTSDGSTDRLEFKKDISYLEGVFLLQPKVN